MAINSEADKKKLIPTINDHPQVVVQPYNSVSDLDLNPTGPEDVADGYVGMKDPCVRLSKNMKLSMRHVGFKERAIPVSEEWKWVDGEAVPPAGREDSVYTQPDDKKYTDYGTVSYEKVAPFDKDPSEELAENIVVTEATAESNDDNDMVEAVPVLAVNRKQGMHLTLEGRRGEAYDDPITNNNYLTRPGMEVATEDTYLSQIESTDDESPAEAESEPESTPESSAEAESEPESNNTETPQTPEPTYYYTEVDKTSVLTPEEGVEYFVSDGADGYTPAGTITEWAEGVTYYTRSTTKKRTYTRRTASK